MKVLEINATYANGSTGTIVKDIQQCCEDNGIDCYVAYASSSVPKDKIKNGYKIGNFFSNKLHALLCRINGKQAYFSYLPTLRFLFYLNKLKPDVIHLHNLHSNYINLNMLLRYIAKKNIATVVTLHDCWFYTGGCFHYTNAQCDKWTKSCGNCPKKKKDTIAYFQDSSSQILKDRYKYFRAIKNLTIVGVSRWITEECQKSVFKGKKCINIYNGVDTNIFKPTPSNLKKDLGIEGKFIILGPASKWLDPVNEEVFEDITKRLDPDSVLVLFGCPSNLPQLPHNVKTIGFTKSKEELAQVYSIADVFVNCTREDTLPTINMEAQACGVPVITFDNTGASETINETSGCKIKTGDATSLFEHIKLLKEGNILFYKDSIQKQAELIFDKEKNYQKYIKIFNFLIQSFYK